MHLKGSCHCGAVRFTLEAQSPVPFMHCHCSICRKTAGGGGFAINLGGSSASLKLNKGAEKYLGRYHALMREPGKRTTRSKAERRFCLQCGSALWLYDPRWPELIHPHASAIDTPLPKPPSVVEAALAYAANWVDVPSGKGHVHAQQWPKESLADWHRRHKLDQL